MRPLASPWRRELRLADSMASLDWGHYSPGSDDAFPTPFTMESIVVIALFPFLTPAFVLFFATAVDATFAFALLEPKATLASPLMITSMFPSALINRGAMPPIKLTTKPGTTVAFAKLVKPLFYRRFLFCPSLIDDVFLFHSCLGSSFVTSAQAYLRRQSETGCLRRRFHANNSSSKLRDVNSYDLPGLHEVYGGRDSGGHSPKCGPMIR